MSKPPAGRLVGDIVFFCGKDGGVHVVDEHDVAADAHADAMNRAHHDRTGEWGSLDQQVEWVIEGRVASERRATIADSRAINAALVVLERHGYAVTPPDAISLPLPDESAVGAQEQPRDTTAHVISPPLSDPTP